MSRPELQSDISYTKGLAALALFVVMAAVVFAADFGPAQGFPSDANVTESIGYAMFNLDLGSVPAEGFLVAFLLIAVVLDVALDGALYLAKRENEDDETLTALIADGGRTLRRTVADDGVDGDETHGDAADDGGDR